MSNNTQLARAERNQVVAAFKTRVEEFALDFVTTMVGEEKAAVVKGQFALAFREAALRNKDLYTVSPEQVAWAVARSAITGLMPGGPMPHVDLIVRRGQLNWQVSSRGWGAIAEKAGWALDIVPVFQDDVFKYSIVDGVHHIHHSRPDPFQPHDYKLLRGFVVYANDVSGHRRPQRQRLVPKATIEELRRSADTQSVWNKWTMSMAEKACRGYVIRRGMVPLTDPESRMAVVVDTLAVPPTSAEQVAEVYDVYDAEAVPETPDTGTKALRAMVADHESGEGSSAPQGPQEESPEPQQPQESENPEPPAERPKRRRREHRQGGPGNSNPGPAQPQQLDPSEINQPSGDPKPDPDEPTEAELEAAANLKEVKRLDADLPDGVRENLRKVDGVKIRLRSYNAKVRAYHDRIIAYHAEEARKAAEAEEAAAERQPGDESEEEEYEPWGVEDVTEMLKQLAANERGSVLNKAGVPYNDLGWPDWDSLDDDTINRVGEVADTLLESKES